MKKFLLGSAMLLLAGCFDADVDVKFAGGDRVEIATSYNMTRNLYEVVQSALGGCPDGQSVLTDTEFVCGQSFRMSVAELLEEVNDDRVRQFDGMALVVERLDAKTLRIVMPLGKLHTALLGGLGEELLADLPEGMAKSLPEGLRNTDKMSPEMLAMFREMLQGHGVTLDVSGAQIVETNGEVSADGRTARLDIPLLTLLEEKPDLPDNFIIVLKTL